MDQNLKNLAAMIILSLAIILGWQFFYEKPRLEKLAMQKKIYEQQLARAKVNSANKNAAKIEQAEVLQNSPRVNILSDVVKGSISLKGLRFDDLTLLQYKQTLDNNSPAVVLLSPSGTKNAYFIEFGWRGKDNNITYPNANTLWVSDKMELSEGQAVNLHWTSPENVKFKVTISIEDQYL